MHTLIGAHTSASGGAFNALLSGREIGANTIQLFTNNQRQWASRKISQKELDLWEEAKVISQIEQTTSHATYLINIASPNEALKHKSLIALQEELDRCNLFKINYLVMHPGAYTSSSLEEGLYSIVNALKSISETLSNSDTILLMENTAGQGTSIGRNFEELEYILRETKDYIPIGICLDTCHAFASGYDVRDEEKWNEVLSSFDNLIGIRYLRVIHLNDSLHPLNSKLDRHTQIGKGHIGLEAFKVIMKDNRMKDLPKYLETPDPSLWKEEIKMLKKFTT